MTDLIQMATLSMIAIACGVLSPFLVLKKMAMFANALSHTILLGITIAFLITGLHFFNMANLFVGALFASFFTALFTGTLIRTFRLQEDASIGLVFTTLFALGIALTSFFAKNVHLGIESVMGNADILQWSDFRFASSLAGINLLAVWLFYRPLQLSSFDPQFAKTAHCFASFFHFLLLFLIALTAVAAFRAVGVLVVLSFLVGPFLIVRLFCHKLSHILFWAPLVGVTLSILGVIISRFILEISNCPISTGGIIASAFGIVYILVYFVRSLCERKLPSSEVQDRLGKAP